MIKLFDNIHIDADKLQFLLVDDEGKRDKRGAKIREVLGYYSTIGSAVKAAYKLGLRMAVKNTNNLDEFAEQVEKLEKLMNNLRDDIDERLTLK